MITKYARPLAQNPFAALDEATKAKLFVLQFRLKKAEREKKASKSSSTKAVNDGRRERSSPTAGETPASIKIQETIREF